MVYLFAVLLFLVVLVFGASSMIGSYAQARQAEAVTEVARIGQINAMGNLVVILLVALVVVAVVGVVVWFSTTRQKPARSAQTGTVSSAPQVDVNMLMQLEMLRALRSMQQLPAPRQDLYDEPEAIEMHWLRQ